MCNHSFGKLILAGIAVSAMSGCLEMGSGTDEASGENGGNPGGSSNNAPTITGAPQGSILVGNNYSFSPSANDPDGDNLTFSIENRPSWATFQSSTGRVTGTPVAADAGVYGNIRISVSDGSMSASLPQFSVTVTQSANGSATLSWTAPTQNSDNSTLTNLAGYKIYYGTSEGNYTDQIRIDNPGITSYVVENLNPDTYYFVSTAFNSADVESDFSNVAVKTVN